MNTVNFKIVGEELELSSMSPVEQKKREEEKSRLETLEKLRITEEMPLPPIQFLFDINGKPCFPRGELVTETGKPKSGKTSFLSMLMGVGIGSTLTPSSNEEESLGIKRIPEAPLKVLWFDTEQSRQSTQDILKERIFPLAQCLSPELIDVYNSRSASWDERLQLLLTAIHFDHPDLVIIDGICDMVADINDGSRVKPVVEKLMAIAQECNCCIVCVIHQNKAADDHNPRGWMGTELNNKSFEIYATELLKPEMIFSIEQLNSRRYRWDHNFYFVMDDKGLPYRSEAPASKSKTQTAEKDNYPRMNPKYVTYKDNVMQVDIRGVFCDLLKDGELLYYELQAKGMQLLECKSTGFWNKLFTQAKNERVVVDGHDSSNRRVWKLAPKATPEKVAGTQRDSADAPPF